MQHTTMQRTHALHTGTAHTQVINTTSPKNKKSSTSSARVAAQRTQQETLTEHDLQDHFS